MYRSRLAFVSTGILLVLMACCTSQRRELRPQDHWPAICTPEDLRALAPGVSAVYLDCKSLTPENLRLLANRPVITEVEVENSSDRADAIAQELGQLPQLRAVGMPWASLSDAGLAFLCKLPRLEKLNLKGCELITGTGFSALSSDSRLRELDLSGTHELRGLPFPECSAIRSLRTLVLTDCYKLRREAWLTIAKLRGLEALVIVNCPGLGEDADSLAGLRALVDLVIVSLWLTDASVASIAGMAHLESLDLSGSQISDAGLGVIVSSLPRLIGLNLASVSSVSDEGIAQVFHCSDLVSLDLALTRLRGPALDKIAALPRLRYLSMSGCEYVETQWLVKLARTKSLRTLHLPRVGSPERAKQLIADLQAVLPSECDISDSDN